MKHKILIYGDFVPTGFGRICRAIGLNLNNLYDVVGACIHWDGILPLQPSPMPFHVCALNGRDGGAGPAGFANVIANVAGAFQPDVIISVQDFPYHETLRATPIDWSTTGHIVITPVDGVPIAKQWLQVVSQFDDFMTISKFGVEAFRQQGVKAKLCPPGVDNTEFHRLDQATRANLRDRLGIPRDAFVVGVMAMNQGRKDFPSMIAGFTEAYKAEPNAYLFLDCEEASAMGWDIPNTILAEVGLDRARVRFRNDAIQVGISSLNERYNLLDLHMVLAHREGYGLPHGEAMITGIPSVSMDYCSGREIIGRNHRGWLVKSAPHHQHAFGTWGGAKDYWPDMKHLVKVLRQAHRNPAMRLAKGEAAMQWAKKRSWDNVGLVVQEAVRDLIAKRGPDMVVKTKPSLPPMPQLQMAEPAQGTGGLVVTAL